MRVRKYAKLQGFQVLRERRSEWFQDVPSFQDLPSIFLYTGGEEFQGGLTSLTHWAGAGSSYGFIIAHIQATLDLRMFIIKWAAGSCLNVKPPLSQLDGQVLVSGVLSCFLLSSRK